MYHTSRYIPHMISSVEENKGDAKEFHEIPVTCHFTKQYIVRYFCSSASDVIHSTLSFGGRSKPLLSDKQAIANGQTYETLSMMLSLSA